MDVVHQMQQRGLVGFPRAGQDAGLCDEHVGSLGERVASAGAENALAESAQGQEDVGEVIWAVCGGGPMVHGRYRRSLSACICWRRLSDIRSSRSFDR